MAICSHKRFSVWLLAIVIAAVLPSAPAIATDNASVSYESQDRTQGDPHLRSLGEYIQGGVIEVAPLGLELRDDQRKLKSGAFANGLLIVAVAKGGPAANAGLEALQEMPKQVLVGLAVAGSMVFPPAMILLPVFASLEIGRDGDLIIAVDGSRVSNVLDFEDDLRDAQPGEIVYLTIVRAGERLQVRVPIPAMHTNGHSPEHSAKWPAFVGVFGTPPLNIGRRGAPANSGRSKKKRCCATTVFQLSRGCRIT